MKYLYGTYETPLPDIYSVYTPAIQAEYPCILLAVWSWTDWRATLYITKEPLTYGSGFGMELGQTYLNSGITADTKEALSNGAFSEPHEAVYSENAILPYSGTVWANYDVLKPDGTLYIAASDPVPVSPVPINPALLVQSFFVGQAIRRSRK